MDTIWLWTTAGWREYVDIGYSDYSGGTVARSNVDTFEAMEDVEYDGGYHLGSLRFGSKGESDPYYVPRAVPEAADIIGYCGSHGTSGVFVRADDDAPAVIREALSALADYPILDEDHLSEIESEAEGEAIPDLIQDLNRMCGIEDVDTDEEDLRAVMEEANVYFEHHTDGVYLDLKRLAPYWAARHVG